MSQGKKDELLESDLVSDAIHKDYGLAACFLFEQLLHYMFELGPILDYFSVSNKFDGEIAESMDGVFKEPKPRLFKGPVDGAASLKKEEDIYLVFKYTPEVWTKAFAAGRRVLPLKNSFSQNYVQVLIDDPNWPEVFKEIKVVYYVEDMKRTVRFKKSELIEQEDEELTEKDNLELVKKAEFVAKGLEGRGFIERQKMTLDFVDTFQEAVSIVEKKE